MAGVTPTQGQNAAGKAIYKSGHGIKLGLFTNNVTPGASTVIGDLTKATATGLTEKSLGDADFTVDSGGETTTSPQDFANTSGADVAVYGWYMSILDPIDGVTEVLLHAERDPNAPVTVPDGGVPYRVTPSGTIS